MDYAIANEGLLEWGPHPRFEGVMTKVLVPGAVNPALSVSRVRVDPGNEIPVHTHDAASETFYILQGFGVCTMGAEEVEFEPGYCFYAAPGQPHGIRNYGAEPLHLLAIFAPPAV